MPDMTTQPPQKDPITTRIRTALDEIYGPRIEGRCSVHARAADSDYDVSVFLRDMPDRMVEMNRLADLGTAILDEPASSSTRCRIARVRITKSACR